MAVAGKWNVTLNTPMGAQQATWTLAEDGGTLTGSMESAQGTVEVAEGTVDGDSFTFVGNLTSPMPIKIDFSGSVDGDTISGNAKLGAFGNAPFNGTRE